MNHVVLTDRAHQKWTPLPNKEENEICGLKLYNCI